ncbi:hypothetical protein Tco_0333655, partial [Tanacetum coccineum]
MRSFSASQSAYA